MNITQTLFKLWHESGFNGFFVGDGWKSLLMIIIAACCSTRHRQKFEPLLLVGIGLAAVFTNLPGANMLVPAMGCLGGSPFVTAAGEVIQNQPQTSCMKVGC